MASTGPSKTPRCPNGTRRNRKTGNCEPVRSAHGARGKNEDNTGAERRSRCPNGTRRNKKTGECEKKAVAIPDPHPDLFDPSMHKRERTIVAKHYQEGLECLLRTAILTDYTRGYNMKPAERKQLYTELRGKEGKKMLASLTDVFSMDHLLEAWYRHYAPDKAGDVDDILEKYLYCESKMWNILYRKYVDPDHRDVRLWFYDDRCEQRLRDVKVA